MLLRTIVMALLCVAMTSVSAEAQSFSQFSTRRGALTGAVIGGIMPKR